ncbi:uncharacterized protein LOC131160141 [Malania oleifera]|uniref:uncharacterized protein LOC131160141 n=1 Tax=Malania oleifera TaxID=397392 RepID=UPI0025ADA167|nr:uncharacterized protein LOC131160141 [Malania oleifera]
MGDSSSASYIRMVQHLIEECIILRMTQAECMEALSKHANIMPVITSTVWKELEKENKEFFEAYAKIREEEANTYTPSLPAEVVTTAQRIQGPTTLSLSDSSLTQRDPDDDVDVDVV